MATLSTPGIGSGLDINGILDKLMTVERQPLVALQNKITSYQTKLSALGSLKSGVSSLQEAVNGLNTASKFLGKTATVADTSIANVTATSSAVVGTYALNVTSLAHAHRISSDPVVDENTTIGSGSLTFSFGTYSGGVFTANPDKASQTVTISSTQNTLAGIRDAVNNADIGVRANIITDSNGSRIVFTSGEAGAANSLRVTVSDDDATHTDTSGLSQLAYDPTAAVGSGKNLTEVTTATNANVSIDGISISSSSNTLTNVVDGLTINLLKESGGSETNITVAQDTTSAQNAIDQFVKSYNALALQVSALTSYDSTTRQAGPLNGDAAARTVQTGLRSVLNQTLTGLSGDYTTLSSVGVTFNKDGTLAFNTSTFQTAIQDDPNAVTALFAQLGRTTDTRVTFSSAFSTSTVGTFDVVVSQAATRGTLVGNAVANLTITAGVNDTLTLDIDGTSASITLAAGTYASASALAAEVQSKLNGDSNILSASKGVTVSETAGVLTITSKSYGISSLFANLAGNAATDLLGGTPTYTTGQDVNGTIGGQSATGSGQFLTRSDGLSLKINVTSTGNYGSVTFSTGFGTALKNAIEDYLETDGLFSSREKGLNNTIDSIKNQEDAFQTRLDAIEKRYRAQFTALDVMLSRMNETSSYLSQQLTALQNSTKQ